jgi:5-formyltetrahydrofolate cyclo-ligase
MVRKTSSLTIAREPVDATDRAAARLALRARRAALSGAQRAQADEAICASLLELVRELSPRLLAVYWPMLAEPDIRAAFQPWQRSGIRLALPRVAASDSPLEFMPWSPGDPLETGPHNTRQPPAGVSVRPDLILIPCLGFDAGCHRLGYGGGYYDRTLERLAGTASIGVGYDDCEICNFDAQPHDLPLDAVVTPCRVLRHVRGQVGS